jgi:hypothetical protein
MAVRFDIKEGKLTVKAETLSVSAFLDIWEFDKDKGKKKALALLKHVMHMCDISSDNPFIDAPANDLERLSKRDCFKDEHYKLSATEKELFDNAANWYTELNKNLPWRSLRVVEGKIDEINTYLTRQTITDSNFDSITKTLTGLDKLHATRVNIEEIVEKQLKKMKVRGGLERSPLERGLLAVR